MDDARAAALPRPAGLDPSQPCRIVTESAPSMSWAGEGLGLRPGGQHGQLPNLSPRLYREPAVPTS